MTNTTHYCTKSKAIRHESQDDVILRILQKYEHEWVCAKAFLDLYIPRYAAVIHRLKQKHEIVSKTDKEVCKLAHYMYLGEKVEKEFTGTLF